MEDKERFKLTEELKEIFRKSAEFVKKEDYRQVSSEIAIYYLFETYFKDGGGKDEILNEYLSGYNKKDRKLIMEALEAIRDSLLEDYTNPLPDKYKNHPVPVNSICNDLLRRAMMQALLFKTEGFKNMDNIEIDSTMFLLSQLFESDEVTDFLNGFDITKESLTELLIAKGKNKIEDDDSTSMNPVAKLKEKILNNPSAVGESSESDEEAKERMKRDDEEFDKAGKVFENAKGAEREVVDPNSDTPYLNKYCDNMIEEAKAGVYDPMIGREDIVEEMIEVLSCRKKSNLVLISEEGVGKDACVQELARRIANGNVPKIMKDKIIFSLNFNKLLINSSLRGQSETRIQGIVDEASRDKRIIIYLPEIHNIIGLNSNGSGGAGDMANVLKPYLTGKISVIGTTTIREFSIIEKDPAFKRRFQVITLKEPNVEETINILEGIKSKYSEFHHVKYPKDIIEICVKLSDRYISERFFPDKAIDIIDMVGAYVSLRSNREEPKELVDLKRELAETISNKIDAVKEQDFEKAASIRNEEIEIRKKVEKLQRALDKTENNPKNWDEVTIPDVLRVISRISRVPIDKLGQSELEKIDKLEKSLKSNIIGQDEGINEIIKCLQRNALNLRDPKKPIASILLCSASGLGKTKTGLLIAKEYFGGEKNMIRIDMNEYKGDESISRLTGSSPNFVGFGTYRAEFDKVRTNPYTVIIFDEIEKASKAVLDSIMSVLDEGHIRLNNGVDVDFKNTVILATSNLGSKQVELKGDGLGFSKLSGEEKDKSDKSTIMKEIKKFFRPEFLNRISKIVFYKNLSDDDFRKILELELNKLSERIKQVGPKLKVSNSLKERIVKEVDKNFNVRSLQRNVVKYIEDEICEAVTNQKVMDLKSIATISVDLNGDKVEVSFIKKTEKKPKKKEVIEIKADEEKTESVVE